VLYVKRGEVDVVALELLAKAEQFYEAGLRLLEEGDHFDACEEAWAVVKSAAQALTLRWLGRTEPPRGTSWREFVAKAFMRAGVPEGEAWELAAFFVEARGRLHGECFYGQIFEEKEHEPLIRSVRKFLDRVKELVKASGVTV